MWLKGDRKFVNDASGGAGRAGCQRNLLGSETPPNGGDGKEVVLEHVGWLNRRSGDGGWSVRPGLHPGK